MGRRFTVVDLLVYGGHVGVTSYRKMEPQQRRQCGDYYEYEKKVKAYMRLNVEGQQQNRGKSKNKGIRRPCYHIQRCRNNNFRDTLDIEQEALFRRTHWNIIARKPIN